MRPGFFTSGKLLVLLLLALIPIQGRSVELLSTTPGRLDAMQLEMEFFEDPRSILSIADILAGDGKFHPIEHPVPNFGFSKSSYWFKVVLNNPEQLRESWILEIAYPLLDSIDFYLISDDEIVKTVRSGDQYPFWQRSIEDRTFTFPVEFDRGSIQAEAYFKIRTSSSFQIPVSLWRTVDYYRADHHEQLLLGLYYGFLFAILLYNLLLARAIRDSVYLYYCTYVATYCLFQMSINGLGYEYLWPSMIHWNERSTPVFMVFCITMAMMFSRRFLRINKSDFPWLNFIYLTAIFIQIPLLAVAIFADYLIAIQLLTVITALGGLQLLISGFVVLYKNGETAKFYVTAWSFFLLGVLVYAFKTWGIVPKNFFTEYAIQIGSASEMLLLSYALADRFNRLRDENTRIQKEATLMLEQRVNARTAELQDAMHKLSKVNDTLERLSTRDSLTDIYNRTYFNQQYDYVWQSAVRTGSKISLLMIDIDHFKSINDRFGHVTGDQIIVGVVERIQEVLPRSTDFLARYGGEEFVVVLPHTNEDGALRVAERILEAVSLGDIKYDQDSIKVTVSIGVADITPERHRQSRNLRLIERADRALYAAKNDGRNCIRRWAHLVENDDQHPDIRPTGSDITDRNRDGKDAA